MLASGDLVCANDVCWRVMRRWYKEKEDGQRLDRGAQEDSQRKDESSLGEEEGGS
jgi:hypothetical protein